MSNKRPPLLSDHDLMEMMFFTEDGKRPSEKIREFYEDLITDGTLRVVEEVEPIRLHPCDFWRCPSCHTQVDFDAYCKMCGNKIKR